MRYDPVSKPGVSNLLQIIAALNDCKPDDVAPGYTQYGQLKQDAGEAVIEALRPIQARTRELLDDPAELTRAVASRRREGPRRRLGHAATRLRRHRPPPPIAEDFHKQNRARTLDFAHQNARPDRSPHRRAGHPRARQPRRRAAVRAGRHRDRRAPRHGPARRAGAVGHRAVARGQRLHVPDLRHDRAGGTAHRGRRSRGSGRRRGAGDVAGGDRRGAPRAHHRRRPHRGSPACSAGRARSSTSPRRTCASPRSACPRSSSCSAPRASSAACPTTARRW